MTLLQDMIDQGYITRKEFGGLYLLNYTNKCIYDKKWNYDTINSRGHVFEIGTHKRVAIPFQKFFNFGELNVPKQRQLLMASSFEVTEKYDGSLGIVYFYDGQWRVNTRGSFNSVQAMKAKEIIERKYTLDGLENCTLLVEIIYPGNRIVVNYGDVEELRLLGAFEVTTRDEIIDLGPIAKKTGLPVAKNRTFATLDEVIAFSKTMSCNEEGFVVRFPMGERVKVKSATYLEVFRVIASLSKLSLWRTMKNGKVNVEAIEKVPEEFRTDIDKITGELESTYNKMREGFDALYQDTMKVPLTHKEIGLSKVIQDKSVIFAMLDKKWDAIDHIIMKRIRPKGE